MNSLVRHGPVPVSYTHLSLGAGFPLACGLAGSASEAAKIGRASCKKANSGAAVGVTPPPGTAGSEEADERVSGAMLLSGVAI